MMRILTGRAKGVKLFTLEGENTRPTSERTKEAVFSMIQFDIEGREVLDLFSGSGQMGLEAVSRGAKRATLVDKSREAIEIINKNIEKTKLSDSALAVCSDAMAYLSRISGRVTYDIVFLDPPYAASVIPDVLKALVKYKLIRPTSIIVCESGREDIFDGCEELSCKYEVIKKAKYGIAYITLLNPKEGCL